MNDIVQMAVSYSFKYLFDVVRDNSLRIDITLRRSFHYFKADIGTAHVFEDHVQIAS